jgi:hypothetical protein
LVNCRRILLQVFTLHAHIVNELPTLSESDYKMTLENLPLARRVLGHPRHAPTRYTPSWN